MEETESKQSNALAMWNLSCCAGPSVRVEGLGFWELVLFGVLRLGCRELVHFGVLGLGFRGLGVLGLGFRGLGIECRVYLGCQGLSLVFWWVFSSMM